MMFRPAILVCVLSLLTATGRAVAQEKAAFDRNSATDAQIGLPSPYDKFLGLDQVLNLTYADWKNVYNEIARSVDVAKYTDESDVALALGVKIADGVMSIKARDVQGLNDCSKEIEDLAKKLGVKDDEMSRAKIVRAHANKGEWLQVFMELGFLQTDIMKSLRSQNNDQRRSLIITAGWMQGLQYTAYVVGKYYSAPVSNYLREPLLVRAMQMDLDRLPETIKDSPKVTTLIAAMPALYSIVNIPVEGSIPKESVDKLLEASRGLVEKIVSP
jgi:hypothetical protein